MVHHIEHDSGITLTKSTIACCREVPRVSTIARNALGRYHMTGRNDFGDLGYNMVMP